MQRLAAALNTYDAIKSWLRSPDWAKWAARHPEDWKIVQYVLKLRGV
jgi:hypothetical protein